MSPREEHVAAAEQFARDNPGWTWDGRTLSSASAFVYLSPVYGLWSTHRRDLGSYSTPGAAVRALATESTP